MIGFDFEYYKPDRLDEALDLYSRLELEGKATIFYAGGSEFISMARVNNLYADAVIDIKGIGECREYGMDGDDLIIGAGVSLREIAEGNLFPLLSKAVKRIADHTMQGKITIGGNICGTIIYREAVLALLISESRVLLARKGGIREELLEDVFDKRLNLDKGEILVKLIVPGKYLNLTHLHVKRTKNETIDYPLVTMVALKNRDKIQMAFSGLADHPFRSRKLEKILNESMPTKNNKLDQAVEAIEDKIGDGLSGSKEYKKFIVREILDIALEDFQEGRLC